MRLWRCGASVKPSAYLRVGLTCRVQCLTCLRGCACSRQTCPHPSEATAARLHQYAPWACGPGWSWCGRGFPQGPYFSNAINSTLWNFLSEGS